MTIELIHAPGHHLDQIVAWIPEISLLLAFDAVENPLPLIESPRCVPHMFATLEYLIALQPRRVLCSHGKTTSPDQLKLNLAYIREIESRCNLVIQKGYPGSMEPGPVSKLINYSLDDVAGETHGNFDRTFYTQAHENNCQVIMHWLMMNEP